VLASQRTSSTVEAVDPLPPASLQELTRLRKAVEASGEVIFMTDRDGTLTYVNPAFERVTGYGRDEVMGKNARFLKSGLQTPWFYDGMWAALTNGLPWSADFINRRKDGSLFTEETVISPIRDPSGAITSYVAVQRDVTQERALAERSTQLVRQRALIAGTIRGLRAGDTPEATAQAIHRALTLPQESRAAMASSLRAAVRERDITRWVQQQLYDLKDLLTPPGG